MTQYSGSFTLQQQAQALTSGQWCTDPYFKNTTLLLHADGAPNGSQNNTFLDSSSNAFAITRNGNATQGSFSPYMPNGYWANYFDGSGDYLTAPSSAGSLGSGDFTVECWIYCTGTSAWSTICSNYSSAGSTAFAIFSSPGSDNKIGMYVGNTIAEANSTIALNVWTHVAAVRSSGISKLYINGVAQTTTVSYSGSASGDGIARIGCAGDNPTGTNYTGYISNMRWVVGSAVYTSNFTPSTTPLTAVSGTSLLTCQSNRFVDNSTNAFALTVNGTPSVQSFQPFMKPYQYSASVIGGSGYFDGSGDYLTTPSNSAFATSTNSFTFEAWVYPTAAAGTWTPIASNGTNSGGNLIRLNQNVNGTGKWGCLIPANGGGDNATFYSTNALVLNTWTHVAVVRNGSTITLYENGVQVAQQTSQTWSFTNTTGISVGYGAYVSDGYFTGYISNLRFVNGTAVYTTTFTPPTSPVTAVSGTSLLTNFTNAGIYDNAMQNNLETVGNAQVSTSVVKYGTGSLYFDGTGDYLIFPDNQIYNMGTGDFTIEMWAYSAATQGAYAGLITFTTDGGNGLGIGFGNGDNKLRIIWGNTQTILASSAMSNMTWTHVALVRSNATVTLYQNGTSVGTYNISTSAMPYINVGGAIGRLTTNTNGYYFNGYIDDLRITKGVARYTANFQPPQVAFANQ